MPVNRMTKPTKGGKPRASKSKSKNVKRSAAVSKTGVGPGGRTIKRKAYR